MGQRHSRNVASHSSDDHIMGFFCHMVTKGCELKIENISSFAMQDLSKKANVIPQLKHSSGLPFCSEENHDVIPKEVLVAMVMRSNITMNNTLFFTEFCN